MYDTATFPVDLARAPRAAPVAPTVSHDQARRRIHRWRAPGTFFDRARARAVYAQHVDRLRAALRQMCQGLLSGCNRAVAQAATESTLLSQLILPKTPLAELRALAAECQLLGINCAHSGTVLGLMYQHAPGREELRRLRLARAFGGDLPVLGAHRIIGWGSHEV